MTGAVSRCHGECWGGFPEEGPLGRDLRVSWSYPGGGGGGGGRGVTVREREWERRRERGGERGGGSSVGKCWGWEEV